MKFTYYGQSCFLLEFENIKLLFDPFISGNELAKNIDIQQIESDYILISHGHADHIADCEAIARRTGATVICSWEIYEWLQQKGITNIHPMNVGGQWNFDHFRVKCTAAQHSSGLPDGSYGGTPMGFIIFSHSKSIYYSGDTSLTLDMQLIPLWAKLDAAILPIGDNFTMGYEDAATAASFVACKNIIGVHFDTFGYIKIDHERSIQYFKQKNIQLTLPMISQTIDI